jgi:hypothetical protein
MLAGYKRHILDHDTNRCFAGSGFDMAHCPRY